MAGAGGFQRVEIASQPGGPLPPKARPRALKTCIGSSTIASTFHTLGEGLGILFKLDEDSSQSLVKHALSNRNTNLLTDEDLRQIIVQLDLGRPVPAVGDAEMMIEILANHCALEVEKALLNFQSTEEDEATHCLLKDPLAEAAWL